MRQDWVILHGGALGDLALTMQLVLRLPGIDRSEALHVVSRTDPGDLSICRPRIVRTSSETMGLHWLFGDHDDAPPWALLDQVRGRRVLSALGGTRTKVHERIAALRPAALYSIDPRPVDGVQRHITQQWQSQLEAQGLLVPKCIHQRPTQRVLGVPDELRERGGALLRRTGCDERAIVIHLGSGGRRKCWSLSCFVDVARRLRDDARSSVCLVTGPVEEELWSASELDALAQDFPLLRCFVADDLVGLVAAARVLVGNDAGPSHLAALLGTPTVCIFGPTSPLIWQALGLCSTIIWGDPAKSAATWGVSPGAVSDVVLSLTK